jgi:hypothetical protein
VRGYGEGVLLVILDEASFMPPELWTAAHYTALDERASGSRVVMLGTPFGSRDHFFRRAFEAGRDGDPDHASFHWTFEANPNLDRAYLARQRERVSPPEYAAEVLGEWSDAAGQLFPDELIEAQTAPVEVPTLAGLIGLDPRPALGLDWGVSFDRSAAAIVYRLPGMDRVNAGLGARPRLLLIPHVWAVRTRLSAIVEEVHRLLARYILTETSGVACSAALCAAILSIGAGEDPVRAALDEAELHADVCQALAHVERGEPERIAELAGGPLAGVAWTTLAVGIWALAQYDYEAGVQWAISLGGDTDTNAAVTGALIGFRDGAAAIPERWLGPLRERERIESVAEGLSTLAARAVNLVLGKS